MVNKLSGIFLVFLYFCALSCAQNAGDTLVLVDNLAIRETHSIFFKGLQGKANAGEFLFVYMFAMAKTDVSIFFFWR